jgi:hypothetical protein
MPSTRTHCQTQPPKVSLRIFTPETKTAKNEVSCPHLTRTLRQNVDPPTHILLPIRCDNSGYFANSRLDMSMRDGTSRVNLIPRQYLGKHINEGAKADSRCTGLSHRQLQRRHNGSHFRVESRAGNQAHSFVYHRCWFRSCRYQHTRTHLARNLVRVPSANHGVPMPPMRKIGEDTLERAGHLRRAVWRCPEASWPWRGAGLAALAASMAMDAEGVAALLRLPTATSRRWTAPSSTEL